MKRTTTGYAPARYRAAGIAATTATLAPCCGTTSPRLIAFEEGWLSEALRRLEDACTAGETVAADAVEAMREALRAIPVEGGQG